MTEQDAGVILVAPNRFPGMERERALGEEFGRELVVAADDDEFYATLPRACLVFMSTSTLLPAAHIEGAGMLRGILRYGVGYDNIDVAAAARLGIPVTNVPASASEEVATHAVAMALNLQRRISQGDALIRGGSWGGDFMNGVQRLSTQTVGIVGLGRIGWKTAERFQVFGCRVIGYDPFPQQSPWPLVSLEQILAESDIVSLHLPLTNETLHLLGERELAALKPGAIVINVSRGGLVDEAALAAALGSGHLGGAGIDVFEREPLAADHPLRDSPRTLLSAHMAWKSDQSLDAYQDVVVGIARQILSGAKPDFVVNGVE